MGLLSHVTKQEVRKQQKIASPRRRVREAEKKREKEKYGYRSYLPSYLYYGAMSATKRDHENRALGNGIHTDHKSY